MAPFWRRGRILALCVSVVSSVVAGESVHPALADTAGVLARAPTVMYWGDERIGTVDPNATSSLRVVAIDCPGYSGGFVQTNRQGTWLVAFTVMDYNFGFARLLQSGKWSFYAAAVVGSSHG